MMMRQCSGGNLVDIASQTSTADCWLRRNGDRIVQQSRSQFRRLADGLAGGAPRPFFPDQTLTFNGGGFPSGHAMTATVLFGALAMIVLRQRVNAGQRVITVVAAAMLVAIVAATRVYLGAHYFTDVVGGIAFGLLWLTICEFLVSWVVRNPAR